MNIKPTESQYLFRLPTELKRQLKILSAETGISMRELLVTILEEFMAKRG